MIQQAGNLRRPARQRGKFTRLLHFKRIVSGVIDRRDNEAGIRQRRRRVPMAEIGAAKTMRDDDERIFPFGHRAIPDSG
ncbi:hypothetical protein D3C78_1689020 [compost metagenome]